MGDASDTNNFIWLNDDNGGLRFRSSTGATTDFSAVTDTLPRHYALVADGAGSLALYVDGRLAETKTVTTSFTVNAIGKAYPTSNFHYNFQGVLDEVRLEASAATAAEILARYEAGKPEFPHVEKLYVYLIGGQSNADGRAEIAGLPAEYRSSRADVDFYHKVEGRAPVAGSLAPGKSETGQFGPEVLFGHRLGNIHAHEEGARVALIKYANGGTNLHTHWKAGGDATTTGDGPEYQVFQATVHSGLAHFRQAYPAAEIILMGMIWMQGESDAVAPHSTNYLSNLAGFIADVRTTFDATLPFIIGRLSSAQTALDATQRNNIRSAQDAAAADPLVSLVDTDGFGMKSDRLHFDAAGQMAMGSAFAGEAAYHAWVRDTFAPEDIAAGRAEPDADPDGDGRTNREEFLAGTGPLAVNHWLRAWITAAGPDQVEIRHESSPGRLYAVERYVEESGSWSGEASFLPGTGDVMVRPAAVDGRRALFRVTIRLP